MDIEIKTVSQLTPAEYRELYNLNFRQNGSMQHTLLDCKNNYPDNSKVYMIKNDNKVISWSLVFAEWFNGDGTVDKRYRPLAYFYTRRDFRGRGYASDIIVAINEQERRRPRVVPHDKKSRALFAKNRKLVDY